LKNDIEIVRTIAALACTNFFRAPSMPLISHCTNPDFLKVSRLHRQPSQMRSLKTHRAALEIPKTIRNRRNANVSACLNEILFAHRNGTGLKRHAPLEGERQCPPV
jgi:hypothetical protein